MGKKNHRSERSREASRGRDPVRVREVKRGHVFAETRRVLDPRDLPGLSLSRDVISDLTRPTSKFGPIQFAGPKPGVVTNPSTRSAPAARATLAQRAISEASAPSHRPGGASRQLGPIKKALPSVPTQNRDVDKTRLHGPNHSLQVREPTSCKERPDNTKSTRGGGASRAFIPWCSRRT